MKVQLLSAIPVGPEPGGPIFKPVDGLVADAEFIKAGDVWTNRDEIYFALDGVDPDATVQGVEVSDGMGWSQDGIVLGIGGPARGRIKFFSHLRFPPSSLVFERAA